MVGIAIIINTGRMQARAIRILCNELLNKVNLIFKFTQVNFCWEQWARTIVLMFMVIEGIQPNMSGNSLMLHCFVLCCVVLSSGLHVLRSLWF